MMSFHKLWLVAAGVLAAATPCFAAIDPWVSGTSYPISSIVRGSDNNFYRSIVTNPTDNPTTDGGGSWVLEDVYTPTTLTVSSGGRFTTLTAAYAFVAGAKITAGNTVTLAIASGYTSYEPGPVTFDTSQGARLQVVGGTGSTLNFTTNTSNFGGIVIQSGCSLDLLTGVSIVGHIINSQSTYNQYAGAVGVFLSPTSYLGIQQVSVTGFDTGVLCYGNLFGLTTGGLTVSNSGDQGVSVQFSGSAFIPYVSVSGVGNYAPGGLGFGIAVGQGGAAWCSYASVANAANVDYYALGGGELYCYAATSSGTSNYVYYPAVNTTGNYNAIVWNPYVLQGGGGSTGGGGSPSPAPSSAARSKLRHSQR